MLRLLLAALLLSGCYSASLLTTPEPTPRHALRIAPAIVARPGSRNLGMSHDEPMPGFEASARYGIHDRFDLGIKDFREVVIDEVRTAMTHRDVLFQFAFAVQISTRPR